MSHSDIVSPRIDEKKDETMKDNKTLIFSPAPGSRETPSFSPMPDSSENNTDVKKKSYVVIPE